jgi:hypothetical protein
VDNDYVLALVCSSGNVFASGLSTSQPICYRIGLSSNSYSLTYTNLTSAASDLGLAATPMGSSSVSRLTAFTRSSNAWVAKLKDTAARTAVLVRVARAIPPTTQNPSFTCPAVNAGLESAATNNLNVAQFSKLYGSITTVAYGNANVSSVPRNISIPVSITAPAAMCSQLTDPGPAGTTSLDVEPFTQGTTVAACSSMGVFRAVAPVQSNGGSCVLSANINCTILGWGQATLGIPLSGLGRWALPPPVLPAEATVKINVVSRLAGRQEVVHGCKCRLHASLSKITAPIC